MRRMHDMWVGVKKVPQPFNCPLEQSQIAYDKYDHDPPETPPLKTAFAFALVPSHTHSLEPFIIIIVIIILPSWKMKNSLLPSRPSRPLGQPFFFFSFGSSSCGEGACDLL
jgi:hypothetical protein